MRRLAFGRGSFLILDEPSAVRHLIVNAPAGPWWPVFFPSQSGVVISLGLLRGVISTFRVMVTHCDTKDGCTSNLPGCNCSELEVTTQEGDDAWACLCDRHGSP